MAFKTFSIGRRRDSDIRLVDETVSRMHAELTLTTERRYFLVDRNSLRGTWVFRGSKWCPHRQGYVTPRERLRFGKVEVRLLDLSKNGPFSVPEKQPGYEPVSIRPRLNVETGEVKA